MCANILYSVRLQLRSTVTAIVHFTAVIPEGITNHSPSRRELEEMSKGENIVKWIKGRRIRWLGHLERMEEDRMPKKIFTQEMEGTRRGRLRKRWKEEVERDLQGLGLRRWRELVADRKKMEGHCSTGQSPQWAVVPMEEEEEVLRELHFSPASSYGILFIHPSLYQSVSLPIFLSICL